MKEILTKNGHCILIDDEDLKTLDKWTWHAAKSKSTFYAHRTQYLGGGRKNIKSKLVSMHRILMNCPEGMQVDHIDGNGLNNQKSNLRICTNQQNNFNQKKQQSWKKKPTTSKYKGVTLRNGIWLARIRFNNKLITIGNFHHEDEAALAYDAKAAQLFGEFAYLNFKRTKESKILLSKDH